MTSLATGLGALPLALAAGAGSEARQAIGWVVVGGLSVGTLFTLFVIPTAYTVLVRDARPAAAQPAGATMPAGQA
jgi:multidrug efflux pump